MKQWYEIKALAQDKAEVWIYEEIGENFWGEGITAKRFVSELNALNVSAIDLHVNSPGGNVTDGQTIYTALVRHPAFITTYIDGAAWSIASVVALAGDKVIMPVNATMMIHEVWAKVVGFASDMRRMADTVDKLTETVLNVYADHSTKSREELAAAMAVETILTAADAVEYGFVDEVVGEMRVAACFDLDQYRHPQPALFLGASVESASPSLPEYTPPEVAETPDVPVAETTEPARDLVLVGGRFVEFPRP